MYDGFASFWGSSPPHVCMRVWSARNQTKINVQHQKHQQAKHGPSTACRHAVTI